MLADPRVILNNKWLHTMALLTQAHKNNCKVGLATMLHCEQVVRLLRILELSDVFDFIASWDDVEHGKPNTEMYFLVAYELGVSPAECLVIEDSLTGVKAALNESMQVMAVSTPFTQKHLHESNLFPAAHVVEHLNRGC